MYFYGLGEFFYTNGIEVDEENFMNIECTIPHADKSASSPNRDRNLSTPAVLRESPSPIREEISPLLGGASRSDKGVVKEQQFSGNLICI